MTNDQLRNAISDLAAIDNDGLLREVRLAFAHACREAGGLPDADERQRQLSTTQIGASVQARELAKVASHLFGVPEVQCDKLAREVIVRDPWTAIALEVIADHLPASAPAPTATPKAKGVRKW